MTSDDCIVVIPTGIEREAGTELARTFSLHISDRERPVKIKNQDNGFTYILVRGGGLAIEKVTSEVTASGWVGDPTERSEFHALPYEPGEIIIMDVRVVYTTRSGDGDTVYSSIAFTPLAEGEKEWMMNKLSQEPKLRSWFE